MSIRHRGRREQDTAATVRRAGPCCVLLVALVAAQGARADDRLDALREVVERACDCAAARPSGLDAAVTCTEGPSLFGRMKVAARDGWTAAEAAEAATLERIIETCIANALDRASARQRLGLAARPGPVGAAPTVWTQIRVADLGAHPARLVRLHTADGPPLKGLVAAAGADEVVLRLARSDGGGERRIPVGRIREAWIMDLR